MNSIVSTAAAPGRTVGGIVAAQDSVWSVAPVESQTRMVTR